MTCPLHSHKNVNTPSKLNHHPFINTNLIYTIAVYWGGGMAIPQVLLTWLWKCKLILGLWLQVQGYWPGWQEVDRSDPTVDAFGMNWNVDLSDREEHLCSHVPTSNGKLSQDSILIPVAFKLNAQQPHMGVGDHLPLPIWSISII